jgi:hypothetical protein
MCHPAPALPDYPAPDAAPVAYAASMACKATRGFPKLPRKKQLTDYALVVKVLSDELGESLHLTIQTFGIVGGRIRDQIKCALNLVLVFGIRVSESSLSTT